MPVVVYAKSVTQFRCDNCGKFSKEFDDYDKARQSASGWIGIVRAGQTRSREEWYCEECFQELFHYRTDEVKVTDIQPVDDNKLTEGNSGGEGMASLLHDKFCK